MTNVRHFLFLLLCLMLTACGSGAVVFAPTPLPPDLSPVTLRHPSGAFSIAVPPNWAVYTQNDAAVVSYSFSPPGYDAPALTAAVVRLSSDAATIEQLANEYQTLHRPDQRRYVETDRAAQPDGSWRFSGVRTLSDGTQLALNTFVRLDQQYVSVVDALVPDDAELREQLEVSVNTLTINTVAELPPVELSALSFVHTATLEIQNAAAWTNPTGVLFVTGEIANYTGAALSEMPVRVALLDAAGNILIEAADRAMGYHIADGGFAPFSLRFGTGQPVDAVEFRVTMGDQPSQPPARTIIAAPVLQWTDESIFTPEGRLLVSGTVTNTGNQTAFDPVALVTVFDGSGDVIGAWYQTLSAREIAPGGAVPYEVNVIELGGGARNYIVDIQAYGD